MTQRKTNSRGLRALVVVVVTVLCISSAGVGTSAGAVPEPPHEVFGTVTDQNGDAVAGTTIEVIYNGEVINTTTTNSNGYYEIQVTQPSSGDQFTVSASSQGKTLTYEVGGSTEVNFQPSPEPTTTTPTTTTTAPAGGGGGAGGAGGQLTTAEPPAEGATGTAPLGEDNSATINLPEGEHIASVFVSVPSASGEVTVTELMALPEGVPEAPGVRVALVNISAPDPDGGPATVRISVRQSALPDDVTAAELGITHYTNGAWQPLNTSLVSSDGPIVLEANVSSFSPFAVTAQEQPTTTTPPTTETTTETTAPPATTTTAPSGDGGGFPVIPVVVVAIIILALAAWLYTQRE